MTEYQYDDRGHLLSVTEPNGSTVSYTYDDYGNRTGLIYPDGKTVTYSYDNMNRLIAVIGADGKKTTSMTFRRNKKAVITWYYLCGAIGGYILFINLRPENDLWEAFLAGFLFFLVPVTVFQLWFFLIGDMDIIQLDDKGISITLIRLVRKKQYEFTSWDDITAIKTKHLGRGGTVFILEACSFDEATCR